MKPIFCKGISYLVLCIFQVDLPEPRDVFSQLLVGEESERVSHSGPAAGTYSGKVPAIYYDRFFVKDGGLISYGPIERLQYEFGANYVDRILRGSNPRNLPVKFVTKFESVINLKTARTLGISIPETLLATADEVIE
jgi:putative tryptophan/tyrosine transport system substrate-binding protein